MGDYRAWLIDLDGTLYRSRPVKLAMAAEVMFGGPLVWRVIREFRKQHEMLRKNNAHSGGDQFARQIRQTAASSGCSVETVQRVIQDWMFERPGRWLKRFKREELLRQIQAFRANGGRTALVSDYPALTKLHAMGIDKLFDVVIANGEPDGPENLKPAPDGYLRAAARLGVKPAESLVIGDRSDADGLAAQAAGMDFCHVRDARLLNVEKWGAVQEVRSVASVG